MSTMHLFQMKPLANTFNAEDTKRYFIGDNCDCTKLEIAGTLCPRSILVSHWISQTRFFSTSFPCRSWPALDLGELKPWPRPRAWRARPWGSSVWLQRTIAYSCHLASHKLLSRLYNQTVGCCVLLSQWLLLHNGCISIVTFYKYLPVSERALSSPSAPNLISSTASPDDGRLCRRAELCECRRRHVTAADQVMLALWVVFPVTTTVSCHSVAINAPEYGGLYAANGQQL